MIGGEDSHQGSRELIPLVLLLTGVTLVTVPSKQFSDTSTIVRYLLSHIVI